MKVTKQDNISEHLLKLQKQLFDVSGRNPFVHINIDKLFIYGREEKNKSNQLNKIYAKQQYYLKEYGLETTLFVSLFIKWKLPNKNHFYHSPLLYKPCRVKKAQKIDLDFKIRIDEENWTINPIVAMLFKKNYNFEFKSKYEDNNDVINELKKHFDSKDQFIDVVPFFLDAEQWQLVEADSIGTFNYKKSVLGMDFDSIINSPNDTLSELLGFKSYIKNESNYNSLDLLELDDSQKDVVAMATTNNVVIEGPPGTGKSHTIATLIKHYMSLNKKVLFVSEKKSALDVVYDRMGELRTWVAYFDAESKPKKSYYKALKKSYEIAITYADKLNFDEFEFNLHHQNSQIYPANYIRVSPRLDISMFDLENRLVNAQSSKKEFHPQSQIPDFQIWKENIDKLLELEQFAISKWQLKTLGSSPFLLINPAILNEKNPIIKIDKKLTELKSIANEAKEIQAQLGLDLTWDEFTKYCISASILNLVNKSQMDVLVKDSKQYKLFDTSAKKYQLTRAKLVKVEALNTLWSKKPSISEIELFEAQKKIKSIFFSFRKKRNFKSLFNNFRGKVTPIISEEILYNIKQEFEIKHELEELKIKLKHNLNILDPEYEIDTIIEIRKRLDGLSHDVYQAILERNNSIDCIGQMSRIHSKVGNFNRIKNFLFKEDLPDSIINITNYIERFQQNISLMQFSLPEVKTLLNLPGKVLRFVRLNQESIKELDFKIYYYALESEKRFEPYLKALRGEDLIKDIERYNSIKSNIGSQYLKTIASNHHSKWEELEELATVPNSKLSDPEILLKKQFKLAKRRIVHEINKRQQHLPVKQLFQESGNILLTLQSVWMMNPLAIAERLPLDKDLFDVVIFDESSQIPLEDAIPAIYRAKQTVIVGDNKQMPPSRFFSSNTESVTLLNQAEFNFPKTQLKWHYRSKHPGLIQFSNRHFYDQELKLFPPSSNVFPIKINLIENGLFENNVNLVEAKEIAERLEELLKQGKSSIGIIAFSKEQEKCIRKAITKLKLTLPESVLIRNLENTQGIEKEIIIISIGYAKNKKGVLNKNFGPVNQSFGENRLNVLFTRAISKLEVFSSIEKSDLSLTDNNGLMILRDFLGYIEGSKSIKQYKTKGLLEEIIYQILKDSSSEFSYYSQDEGIILNAFVQHSKNKILIVNPGTSIDDKIDVNSVIKRMSDTFDDVKILLNHDWLSNPERLKEELITYFN